MADDLEQQRERERIEAGWELGRKPVNYQRDIVDMDYDDGLTPKEALEIGRQHRVELAQEFREAVKCSAKGVAPQNDMRLVWCRRSDCQ